MPEYIPIPPDRQQALRRTLLWEYALAALVYTAGWTLFLARPPFVVIGLATIAALALNAAAATHTARRTLRLRFRQLPLLPYPLSLHYQIARSAEFCSLFALMHAGMYGQSKALSGLGLTMLLLTPPAAIGFALLIAGFNTREPSPPCCPRCAYPSETHVFPAMCPECAHPLPSAAATTTTPRIRRPGLGWAGATIASLCMILYFGSILNQSAALAILPLQTRLGLAATDCSVFKSINPATLTPPQRDRLIDDILAARPSRSRYEIIDQLEWVAMELQLGRLTQTQSDTFAADGIQLAITTDPPEPKLNQPLTISLTGEFPTLPQTINAHYFLAEITINGQPVLTHLPTPFDPDDLAQDWLNRHHRAERGEYKQPTTTGTPTTADPLRIQARIITILAPNTAIPAITWHTDGTCTITPAPLTTHERTAETTLRVAP